MSLVAGSRLGCYEILSPLGAGGMGEVFRARDTKLNRDVAIKVLPAAVAEDRERVARFRREAQLVASLNHPNIAAIYGLEESNGNVALALELVDGEDLAQRLTRGPIPVDEALAIARQIAEGLEAAHEKGIVHRDLKPANVKLTKDGVVKILDFGLAKAYEGEPGSHDSGVSQSPTMSRHMTEAGMILGTAAYMSPEQARGRSVDKRADIWSFGVVLHEMLTGKRLFAGETVSDTLAAVLRQDVDLSALPPGTPAAVKRLLARCLTRDPKHRLRDIGDARLELEIPDARETLPASTARSTPRARPAAAAAAVFVIALAALTGWLLKPVPAPVKNPVIRASTPMRSGFGLTVQRRLLAIAPDGHITATITGFLGSSSWVELRGIDELAGTRVAGTDGARSVFFSPDSRFIGFTTETTIQKINLASRESSVVADLGTNLVSGPLGVSWGDDGTIYFGALDGIHAVPASGGTSRVAVRGTRLAHPWVLAGSRQILYARGEDPTSFSPSGEIILHTFDTKKETVLTTGTSPVFVAPDLLLVGRADGVHAARLSLSTGRLEREPALVVKEVAMLGSASQYDVSQTGTFLQRLGDVTGEPILLPQRVQPGGGAVALSKSPHQYADPRVSPDGRSIAFHVQDQANDVWTFDPARDSMTRFTFEPAEDETPVWSPDGQWLAFSASRGDQRFVYRRRSDGSGPEEVLYACKEHVHVTDWSPDGRTLLVDIFGATTRMDIVRLTLGEKPTISPYLVTRFDESSGRISPDGHWVAYRSSESGRDEIYVQPFPAGGAKMQVSTEGGIQPVWAKDGRTLFYRSMTEVMAAKLIPGETIAFQAPQPLFKDRYERPQGAGHTTFDVFPDGSLLFLESAEPPERAGVSHSVVATFHWLENLDLAKGIAR
ncbi:MAG: protein kinase [Thermoanaerobaculia bacterium]